MARLDALEAKIRRLERARRRSHRALASALAVGSLLLIAVAAIRPAVPETLEAERFTLRDREGKPRAFLAFGTEGMPSLVFLDRTGKKRADIGLDREGQPGMQLLDSEEKARLTISHDRDDSVGLEILDKAHHARVGLGSAPDGVPALSMLDHEDHVRLALDINGKGEPHVQLFDHKSARARFEAFVSAQNYCGVSLYDEAGEERLAMTSQPDGWSGQTARGPQGKGAITLGVNAKHEVSLSLQDKEDRLRGAFQLQPGGRPQLGLFNKDGQWLFGAPDMFEIDKSGRTRLAGQAATRRDTDPSF